MFHTYEVEFCKSVAGGFAAFLKVNRPPSYKQGSPKIAYLFVQAAEWADLEEQIKIGVNEIEESLQLNRLPVRIDLIASQDWKPSLILSNHWDQILSAMKAPFQTEAPEVEPGHEVLPWGAEVSVKVKWIRSTMTVRSTSGAPKPELVTLLLQALADETPESVQVKADCFPLSRTEIIADVFKEIENSGL